MPEKYFQYLVLHVKHFPEKLSKTLPNKSKSKQKQINCNPRTNHCYYLNQIIKKKIEEEERSVKLPTPAEWLA